MSRIKTLKDVVDWRLCLGCGACAWVCPSHVKLMDFFEEGIRPVVTDGKDCESCRRCLEVCPGVESDFTPWPDETAGPHASKSGEAIAFEREWGPITGIWEGYATDDDIRYKGSSGGALTALGAYCLEVLGMHGVLHIAQDPGEPIRNRTRMSRSREELLASAGSRYSPASVCNGLGMVENAPAPCVIIGKPSEIAALRNARKMSPELDRNVGVTLSFFCAESPSTKGTAALLEKLEVDPASVANLRYRGFGWPGHFAPVREGEAEPCHKIPYGESWAFLQRYRPWSVHLWPDGGGELADISCGDPWYEKPDGVNPGFSLVVARTAKGREIVEGAMAAGYLTLTPAESWKLADSQRGLLEKKGEIRGRRVAMKMMNLPVTRLKGLDLKPAWRRLGTVDKIKAILGTLRRVVGRKLYRRLVLESGIGTRPVGEPLAGVARPVAVEAGVAEGSPLNS